MSLQSELDAFRSGWEWRVGEEIARIFNDDVDMLRQSGIMERVAKPGDRFPADTDLRDVKGKPFNLARKLSTKPHIVLFYRGGWCAYSNLELRAYQDRLKEIEELGADVIAISPELPEHVQATARKNDLTFTLLSDVGSKLADALGIRFILSDSIRPFYEKAGHMLDQRHGDGSWLLPVPSTFFVAKGGIIRMAFIEPDYRKRLEPRDAVAALRSIINAPTP